MMNLCPSKNQATLPDFGLTCVDCGLLDSAQSPLTIPRMETIRGRNEPIKPLAGCGRSPAVLCRHWRARMRLSTLRLSSDKISFPEIEAY